MHVIRMLTDTINCTRSFENIPPPNASRPLVLIQLGVCHGRCLVGLQIGGLIKLLITSARLPDHQKCAKAISKIQTLWTLKADEPTKTLEGNQKRGGFLKWACGRKKDRNCKSEQTSAKRERQRRECLLSARAPSRQSRARPI